MADHLFGTSRPPPSPLQIPYDGPVYDGGPWLGYPSRNGWRRPGSDHLFIPESHGPRLECWLYFGVLHAVFGSGVVRHDDFLRYDAADGRQYLTTANLWRYVDAALAGSAFGPGGKKTKTKTNSDGASPPAPAPALLGPSCTQSDWEAIENQLGEMLLLHGRSPATSLLRPAMAFAIRVLHATLFLLVRETLGLRHFRAVLLPQAASRDAWADARMREQLGWCPSEVACFSNFRSVLPQAYALQLGERRRGRTTRAGVEAGAAGGHARCTAARCVVDQVVPGTYVTGHYEGGCRCGFVGVPVEEVKAVLRKGGIPIVRVRRGGEGEGQGGPLVLEVGAHRPGRNYVAVSHVWKDGMGNEEANALPECHLVRLKAMAARLLWERANVPGAWDNPVSALHVSGRHLLHAAMSLAHTPEQDTWFWMDTLCVPLDEETKKMAIRGMKKVYERAHRVMIVDAELEDTAVSDVPKEEIMLRILACSGWMRRLWTLQEGLAARRRLYVVFKDKIVNVPDMADKLWLKHHHGKFHALQAPVAHDAYSLWFQWFRTVTSSYSTFDKVLDKAVPMGKENEIIAKPHDLVSMSWSNVAARDTTKDEDRPVVFANIVNLDPKAILDIKKNAPERMRAFYGMLSHFSQEIIFLPGERYGEEGWRWALQRCMSQDDQVYGRTLETPVKILREGLLTVLPGFTTDLGGYVAERDSEGFWIAVSRTDVDDDGHEKVRYLHVIAKERQAWDPSALHHVGIVFEKAYEGVEAALFQNGATRLSCVVLSLTRREGDVAYGRYELLAEATRLPENSPPPAGGVVNPSQPLMRELLRPKQTWCIG
ncbi:het domain protein [Diplodia corticola]|uniref:Het domain protein n=1 Tax=Diplodia corticola TaxID=236234 RepID=A0A1J9R5Z5_9PEZI|nr:het domain protein [Diplodia corticola]OJD36942.1 het domain protein [Diplodia corticola]